MGRVMERMSSAESGLHEAFMSLLTGFEVCEIICDSTAHVIVAPETLVVVENGGEQRIIFQAITKLPLCADGGSSGG